jgi:myo-inositol-1(or 4)-monophosphatase
LAEPEAEFLEVGIQAAREAGALLQRVRRDFTVREKSGPADLVTDAGTAAQQVIHDRILGRFPEHNFLGEEGLLRTCGTAPYRWIIDPLDGTSNYVHGFPYYAVSIGLQRGTELVAGVIFDPNRDELFTAVRGGGATLNGAPIKVSGVTALRAAMVVASFPPGVLRDSPPIERFMRVLPHAQTVHRTGSAALNLAYVASGRLEAFWSSSLKPWDKAAGVLIVHEAGGRVTRMDGSELDIEVPDLLASNGSGVHDELRQLLTSQ